MSSILRVSLRTSPTGLTNPPKTVGTMKGGAEVLSYRIGLEIEEDIPETGQIFEVRQQVDKIVASSCLETIFNKNFAEGFAIVGPRILRNVTVVKWSVEEQGRFSSSKSLPEWRHRHQGYHPGPGEERASDTLSLLRLPQLNSDGELLQLRLAADSGVGQLLRQPSIST